MARNRLTATRLASLRSAGRHADGDGLYLTIAKSGARSWVFMWQRNGRRREMGLGSLDNGTSPVTLRVARAKADEARRIIAEGGDPFTDMAERQASRSKTFGAAADEFVAAKRSEWTSKATAHQTVMTLETYAKALRPLPVDTIEPADVARALAPIWEKIPETARRTRNRIERVLDYATAHGWRSGDNPARWRGNLKDILPKHRKGEAKHHAAMPAGDVPALMLRLANARGLGAVALRFTILTAARTGETLGATWNEMDLETGVWTIPAERMKAERGHSVPLSKDALALVRALPRIEASPLVFPSAKPMRPLSNMTLAKALATANGAAYTVHGFRSTFRDWIGDHTEYPGELVEFALAHALSNATEAAYRRSSALERRRRMMEAWAEFVAGRTGTIIELRRSAQ